MVHGDAGGDRPRNEVAEDALTDRDRSSRVPAVAAAATRLTSAASARIGAQRTLVLILAIGAGIAFVMAFAASRVYDAVTESDGIAGVDKPVLAAAATLRSPFLDGFAATCAGLFGTVGLPVIAVVACVLLALRRRSATPVTLTVAAGVGSLLMTIAGKDVVNRARPPLVDAIPPFESSPSFPSGHTLNTTVVIGVLAYLLVLRQRSTAARVVTIAAAVVIPVVVGLTRVLLGAHWFTDVLAGWLLGGAWLAMVVTAHRLVLIARTRRSGPGIGQP